MNRKRRNTYNDPVVINPDVNGFLAPQDIELEQVVLGGALSEIVAQKHTFELLVPADFYKEEHNIIYSAMLEMHNVGDVITPRTLTSYLKKVNKNEQVGGMVYIVELTAGVVNTLDQRQNCLLLKEFSIKRKVIVMAAEFQRKAYLDNSDAPDLLKELSDTVRQIEMNSSPPQSGITMKMGMVSLVNHIQDRKENKNGYTGVPSGFPIIDAITHGWQKTDLIIIAARPGMGKTAFIVSALRNAAVDYKIPVGIFSLEMAAIQLVKRLASAETEIPLEDVNHKVFTDLDWTQLIHKTGRLTEAPIFIDDTPALSLMELRAKATKWVVEHDVQLIVIDYLQLMRGDGNEKNREGEISAISRGLKELAKSLNIPVIALSQLSRSVESRGGTKFPNLSDLRESGAIEQDADMVGFIWRPEYYAKTDKNEHFIRDNIGEYVPGATCIDWAKFRNGDPGKAFIKFVGKFTKFVHIDSPYVHLQEYNKPRASEPDLFSQSPGKQGEDPDDMFPTPTPNNGDTPF